MRTLPRNELIGNQDWGSKRLINSVTLRDHSFTRACVYQGVRIVSFSENFAYVLNEWSHGKNFTNQAYNCKQLWKKFI